MENTENATHKRAPNFARFMDLQKIQIFLKPARFLQLIPTGTLFVQASIQLGHRFVPVPNCFGPVSGYLSRQVRVFSS